MTVSLSDAYCWEGNLSELRGSEQEKKKQLKDHIISYPSTRLLRSPSEQIVSSVATDSLLL